MGFCKRKCGCLLSCFKRKEKKEIRLDLGVKKIKKVRVKRETNEIELNESQFQTSEKNRADFKKSEEKYIARSECTICFLLNY